MKNILTTEYKIPKVTLAQMPKVTGEQWRSGWNEKRAGMEGFVDVIFWNQGLKNGSQVVTQIH